MLNIDFIKKIICIYKLRNGKGGEVAIYCSIRIVNYLSLRLNFRCSSSSITNYFSPFSIDEMDYSLLVPYEFIIYGTSL